MTKTITAKRLHSLDALRGFDMFWIMGGQAIFRSLADATDAPFFKLLSHQFSHPDWHGFRIYDLIFPLFLFIAGAATPFSVGSQLQKGVDRNLLLRRVMKRGLLLVVLGIIYNNRLTLRPLEEMRFASVLGRIGLAYMFANIIYLYASKRFQYIWCAGILLGYWVLLLCTAAPGFEPGDLTIEGNFASYVDRLFLPGRLNNPGLHDPEGLLSTVPAIATGLLGIFAGNLLKSEWHSGIQKSLRLMYAGIICLVLAQFWNLVFPINKNLWSSSFVLHTGGLSLLLLALFYFIVDVKGFRKWAFFFTVIGMNSILIYMSGRFIDWKYTTNAFFEWLMQLSGQPMNLVVYALCYILVKWSFLYFLYKKKVFLKV